MLPSSSSVVAAAAMSAGESGCSTHTSRVVLESDESTMHGVLVPARDMFKGWELAGLEEQGTARGGA